MIMSKFDTLYNFMNQFEQDILDLQTISKIIKTASYYIEGLEVDKSMNLLIAADEMLSHQTDLLHNHFQKAWKEFMSPIHKPEIFTTEIGEDGFLTIPDHIMKKLDWEEGDELDLEVHKDGTITIKLAEIDDTPGCMGDLLSEEEIKILKEKGPMGLKSPWDDNDGV